MSRLIKKADETLWDWVGAEVNQVNDIDKKHVRQVYCLDGEKLRPFCSNLHSLNQTHSSHNDISQKKMASKSGKKGEYKCSPVKCAKNPNCLNYLGQDQWESDGS